MVMDKTSRLKYAFGMPEGDISPDDAPLMALVTGVMSAVNAELEKNEEQGAGADPSNLVKQLPTASPVLQPDEVVKIQLAALKMNDVPVPGHGVKVTFNFCTPESRDYLGDAAHLAVLFRDPGYAPLLNFKSVEFQAISIRHDRATQRFTVIGADGRPANFVAHLLLQTKGEERDCWLTDAILRLT